MLLLIALLLVPLGAANAAAAATRRLLHQPFLPADHPPPPPAPPFFPAVPGGAAPPPATYPTTLVLPNTTSAAAPSASPRSRKHVLVLALALPLLALAGVALSLLLLFVFFSRRRRCGVASGKLLPPPECRGRRRRPGSPFGAVVHPPPASAELVRVGNMGGGVLIADRRSPDRSPIAGSTSSSCLSPDLRPLPSLLQQCGSPESGSHRVTTAWTDECDGDEEEFYSPRGSSLKASSSRRTLGTTSEVAVTAPPLTLPSPGESGRRSVELRSESARRFALPRAPPHTGPSMPDAAGYWESRVRMPVSSALSLRAAEAEEEEWVRPKPKLKALHWDSSKVDEEKMMEALFVPMSNSPAKNATAAAALLEVTRSEKMATLLRSLRVSKEEVRDALLRGNAAEALGAEVLEALLKMEKEEEEEEEEEEELEFVAAVPFALRRVEAMLYMATFDTEIGAITGSFQVVEAACDELRSCRLFHSLLDAVLNTGDRMVADCGDAHASELDALLTLVGVKADDGEATLLHLVLREEQHHRGKPGLHAVASLGDELASVRAAAAMDSDQLTASVTRLAGGLGKVADVQCLVGEDEAEFHGAMSRFVGKAEDAIIRAQAQESVVRSLVKEITEYFHGDLDREEAHPFRIFSVVSDFLSVLHRVCGEIDADGGDRFPVPVNPMVFQRMQALRTADSDDQISPSSSW